MTTIALEDAQAQEAYDQVFGPFDRGEFRELTDLEWKALVDGKRKSLHDPQSLALPPKLSKLKSTSELVFPLGDAQLTKTLAEFISAVPDARTLAEVIKRITSSHSYHIDDVSFLANAHSDSYYEFFRTEKSPELRLFVQRCLEFGRNTTSEQEKQIAIKATDALRKLASENRINRVRIEALYGIDLQENDPTKESTC
jgi:hypothetical protein